MTLNKGEFGPEAFLLCIRNPDTSEHLSRTNYSAHLLRRSFSAQLLCLLLSPIRELFNEKDYGATLQQEQLSDSVGDAGAHEHGGTGPTVSPNSNNDAPSNAGNSATSLVKVEVKEEETEDESDEHVDEAAVGLVGL